MSGVPSAGPARRCPSTTSASTQTVTPLLLLRNALITSRRPRGLNASLPPGKHQGFGYTQ